MKKNIRIKYVWIEDPVYLHLVCLGRDGTIYQIFRREKPGAREKWKKQILAERRASENRGMNYVFKAARDNR
jgi:hypothetical protein